jgi:phosphate/sulfate permease
MDGFYLILITIILLLAVIDLIVGVSNDAVNFLNSAIGSKAFPVKTILIVASCGLAVGAIFSSGLMEIARVGIFQPQLFSFHEIIILFLSVMITDILLINFFNTLGIPTSTTVSIIFCLLGASVSLGLLQLYNQENDLNLIGNYINLSKLLLIIEGIFLSIIIAFTVGAVVQFISRLIFTFHYETISVVTTAIFTGFAQTCIGIFVVLKGFGTTVLKDTYVTLWITEHLVITFLVLFVSFFGSSYFLGAYQKVNLLKITVLLGLFGLALSFAGNDLVNFIGVPIAALQSFELWQNSTLSANSFNMIGLASTVQTPYYLLVIAGAIMVGTLWLSKRVFLVTETEINLARQDAGFERFKPHTLSRAIVRFGLAIGYISNSLLPEKITQDINSKFTKPEIVTAKFNAPSFDLVRATVNLMVASILISFATSIKIPLSTTYVTFMVAMGTALADRAWNSESAVYRVAGVLNVIASWIMTSLLAFLLSGLCVLIIFYGEITAVFILLVFLGFVLVKSAINHRKRIAKLTAKKKFKPDELENIHLITTKYSSNISTVFYRLQLLYSDAIKNLGLLNSIQLKQNKKEVEDILSEINMLKEIIFYQINSQKKSSSAANKFYILTLDDLEAVALAISQIINTSYNHVKNNHKKLTFNQIRGLKSIDIKTKEVFPKINHSFQNLDFSNLKNVIKSLVIIQTEIELLLDQQISRVNLKDNSSKNMRLYFDLLKKSSDMVDSLKIILIRYKEFNDTPIDE